MTLLFYHRASCYTITFGGAPIIANLLSCVFCALKDSILRYQRSALSRQVKHGVISSCGAKQQPAFVPEFCYLGIGCVVIELSAYFANIGNPFAIGITGKVNLYQLVNPRYLVTRQFYLAILYALLKLFFTGNSIQLFSFFLQILA